MLKKIGSILIGSVLGLAGLFLVAGRPLGDLVSYLRASASSTVKAVESEIPDAIHDEKTATKRREP